MPLYVAQISPKHGGQVSGSLRALLGFLRDVFVLRCPLASLRSPWRAYFSSSAARSGLPTALRAFSVASGLPNYTLQRTGTAARCAAVYRPLSSCSLGR